MSRLSGRSVAALLRGMLDWHRDLAKTWPPKAAAWATLVYSYVWAIERRQTSIWTMTLEDGQGTTGRWAMLTIEVRNEARAVVQARGRYNRSATSAEHRILLRWAGQNGLSVNVGIGAR